MLRGSSHTRRHIERLKYTPRYHRHSTRDVGADADPHAMLLLMLVH